MKKNSEPPLKRANLTGTASGGNTPVKKISADWYKDYQDRSFVHDSEFEESRIHSQSYDHRIGHIRGKNNCTVLWPCWP